MTSTTTTIFTGDFATNLVTLRAALRALLPNTTIDIVGHRLIVALPAPIYPVGLAMREDFTAYDVGGIDVRRPSRSPGPVKVTPEAVAESIRARVRARMSNLHSSGVYGRSDLRELYHKALAVLAASDFASVALYYLDQEIRDNDTRRERIEAERLRQLVQVDSDAAELAERRRALMMLAPGYDGPTLAPLSEYTDDEPLLDEGGDGEA